MFDAVVKQMITVDSDEPALLCREVRLDEEPETDDEPYWPTEAVAVEDLKKQLQASFQYLPQGYEELTDLSSTEKSCVAFLDTYFKTQRIEHAPDAAGVYKGTSVMRLVFLFFKLVFLFFLSTVI